jgi:hypothetical protein
LQKSFYFILRNFLLYDFSNTKESQSQKIETTNSPKSAKSRSSSTNSLNSNGSSNPLLLRQTSESNKPENLFKKASNSQLNEISIKKTFQPHKDVLKESDIQVKIADLGNACWVVIKIISV